MTPEQQVEQLAAALDAAQKSTEAAGIGLYIVRPDANDIRLSPTAARLLGFPFREETVTREEIRSMVCADDQAVFDRDFATADCVDFRVQRPGGLIHWLEARGGQCGALLDVTAQRDLQQNLSRSNADLQQFSYVASHDLQEPLRTMRTYSQLLQRRYEKQLDQDANEFIHFIVDASRRMDLLVADLLAYSRSMQHDSRPMTDVDMNGIVAWSTLALQQQIKDSEAVVTQDPLPVVTGHEMQLAQLLQHLVGNAIKFRKPGAPLTVHISAEERENVWEIAVRDNGLGIDPQYFERIFGAFKRLHGKEIPGTGIGLAICQNIVAKHNGQLWVESVPGEGSTFYFTLPINR